VTLLAVFKRRVRGRSELVFASDSRLSGGQAMDYGQKVFEMPRSDALFAFAGDTQYAYPLMMQMLRAIEGYPFSADRRLPLPKLKGHTLRVFQQTYTAIHSLPRGVDHADPPDNFFLLGGFDWQAHEFQAWRLSFDKSDMQFVYRPVIGPRGVPFFFAGDSQPAVRQAIRQTHQLLAQRRKSVDEIDMEPFEVLCGVIGGREHFSIGGAPQLGKVYAHLNTQLFQVVWPNGDVRTPHVAGRPLLHAERSVWPVFDPERGFYAPEDAPWEQDVDDDLASSTSAEETGAG
jgi:hypothetical protein